MTTGDHVRPSPLGPGYYLDRYELLCPIADGGMASVWVARLVAKHGFEKLVAIKTILPQFATDNRFQNMFLDEARIASRIQHTNVAHIVDLGEQHDIMFLVMEWVDGDSLSRLFRTTQKKGVPLPANILLRILADTCGGLHAAHELRGSDGVSLDIVHRDVSPQNILLNPLGVAKLIDFGIAKARGRLGEETNAGLLKGKIHYMAPEQAIGAHVDRRADVFSVGAILYHLLAGHPPFDGQNQLAILHRLTSKQPPVPLPSTVHPAVAAIARKALSHSRDARHASTAELQTDIEAAMVEAQLTCTTAQVAAFVREHMVERAQKRKESVELAIAAAAERVRVRDLLKPSADVSSTNLSPIGATSASGLLSSPNLSSPNLSSSSGVSSPGASSSSGVSSPGPTQSSATLKSANLESEIPIDVPPAPIGGKTIGLIAAALIIGVIGTATVMHKRASPPAAPASPLPTPSQAVTSPTTIPTTPPAAPSVAPSSAVPIDALPVVKPTTPSATSRATTVTPPTAATAPTASAKRKVRVSDGF